MRGGAVRGSRPCGCVGHARRGVASGRAGQLARRGTWSVVGSRARVRQQACLERGRRSTGTPRPPTERLQVLLIVPLVSISLSPDSTLCPPETGQRTPPAPCSVQSGPLRSKAVDVSSMVSSIELRGPASLTQVYNICALSGRESADQLADRLADRPRHMRWIPPQGVFLLPRPHDPGPKLGAAARRTAGPAER